MSLLAKTIESLPIVIKLMFVINLMFSVFCLFKLTEYNPLKFENHNKLFSISGYKKKAAMPCPIPDVITSIIGFPFRNVILIKPCFKVKA